MSRYNFNAGETTHYRPDGRIRRFKPKGKLVLHYEGAKPNPVQRLSGGGLSARIFVGLNVGTRKAYSADDVVDIVWRTRKKQGKSADASILSQRGIYEDRRGRRITEPSVQVIIIDFSGAKKQVFIDEMVELAEGLVKKMKQETVIVEVQRRGVVTDVFSVT